MSVTKRDNKILLKGSLEACDAKPGPFKLTYGITEAILILRCQVPSLSISSEQLDIPTKLGHSLLGLSSGGRDALHR